MQADAGFHPLDPGRLAGQAPVAQLDRVAASEAVGRGFESLRARHFPSFVASHRAAFAACPARIQRRLAITRWRRVNGLQSRATLHAAAARWPGIAGTGSVILDLPPAAIGSLPDLLDVDGLCLRGKHEYHLTLFNAQEWRAVAAAHGEAMVRAVFERLDWRLHADGRFWLVQTQSRDAASVIATVQAPALDALRRAFSDGVLEPPTPHITLYWHGSPGGVGIAGPTQWRERVVGELSIDWSAGRAVRCAG
jgi:hypothetical protein